MSLDELRELAGDEPTNETEVAEPEVESIDEPEVEQQEDAVEEVGEYELVIDGEPESEKPVEVTAEEALIHKLSKQRKRAQKAEASNEEKDSLISQLQQRIDALEQATTAPVQQPVATHSPTVPDLYSDEIGGDKAKFDAAMRQYFLDMQAVTAQQSQLEAEQNQTDLEAKARQQRFAKNLAGLAEKGVDVDRIADVVGTVNDEINAATGLDGAFVYLMDAIGDGAEKVAYHLGTNAQSKAKAMKLLSDDPNGLKFIAWAGRLSEKLQPKQRAVSGAPEPDQPIEGGKKPASVNSSKLQEEYDKASDSGDLQKMRSIRQQASERGIELS